MSPRKRSTSSAGAKRSRKRAETPAERYRREHRIPDDVPVVVPRSGRGEPVVFDDVTLARVRRMAECGNTDVDIAAIVGVAEGTLRKHAGDELVAGRAMLRRNVRTWQVREARRGNAALLIWLGKQVLGQRDVVEDPDRPLPGFRIVHSYAPAEEGAPERGEDPPAPS